jgi:hypothetical protein
VQHRFAAALANIEKASRQRFLPASLRKTAGDAAKSMARKATSIGWRSPCRNVAFGGTNAMLVGFLSVSPGICLSPE